MTAIRAVGFDYGGVIGGNGERGIDFSKKVSALLGISFEEYKQHYFSLNHLINLGEVETWRDFWGIFLQNCGKPEKLDELMVLSDEASRQLELVDERIIELVDKLRASGYKVGLLSNNTTENGQKLRAKGLHEHFDVFHISAETKLMKPNPTAFERFAQELAIKPRELAFIDDSEKSLSTAQECGFTPILFRSREQLVEELQTIGIHV